MFKSESARIGISDSRMLQLSVHETDLPLLQMCISLEYLLNEMTNPTKLEFGAGTYTSTLGRMK